MPRLAVLAPVLAAAMVTATGAAHAASTSTLVTPHFRVTLTERCAEGNVGCDDVVYRGVNRRTGGAIVLRGRHLVRLCADGVTPCGVRGFLFRRGAYRYAVSEGGTLRVTRGATVLVHEQGRWR